MGLGSDVGVTADELFTTLPMTLKGPLRGVLCWVGKDEAGGDVARFVFRKGGGSPGGITNLPKPNFPIKESDGLRVWFEGDGGGGATRLCRAFLNDRVLPDETVPLSGVEIPLFLRSSSKNRKDT